MRTFDTVTADGAGNLSLRFVEEDGRFFRTTLAPGSSLDDMPQAVLEAAAYHWTPERIEAARPPTPTLEQVQAAFVGMIQGRLDAFARTRAYDNIHSAAGYAGDEDPIFRVEGDYCKSIKSATWRASFNILAEVQAGTRPVPSSLADIEHDLPALAWPT